MRSLTARLAKLTPSLPPGYYAIPLRLIIGVGFMQHGYAKLVRGPESFTAILHSLGVPAPGLMAWATIFVELFGGLAVLIGAFIPFVSVPMIGVLLGAILTVHLPNGFSSIKLESVDAAGAHFGQPGYETDLLYVAGLIALVLGGPGPLALVRALTLRHDACVAPRTSSFNARELESSPSRRKDSSRVIARRLPQLFSSSNSWLISQSHRRRRKYATDRRHTHPISRN